MVVVEAGSGVGSLGVASVKGSGNDHKDEEAKGVGIDILDVFEVTEAA